MKILSRDMMSLTTLRLKPNCHVTSHGIIRVLVNQMTLSIFSVCFIQVLIFFPARKRRNRRETQFENVYIFTMWHQRKKEQSAQKSVE